MDLLKMLRRLGDRLGIIELSADPDQPAAPLKIQTRTISLDELMAIHLKDVQDLAEVPGEHTVLFDDIFKAAGILPPASGWTVDRMSEFLNTERIRGLKPDETQQEILRKLAEEKVNAEDVIKDAILRDQALDAFTESTLKKRNRWLAEKEQEIQRLEDQIKAEEKAWKAWRARKRQREVDMARALQFLIDKPVISIDEE